MTEGPPLPRLGRYTLIEELAKGGMAQVFVAKRDGSGDICALKKLLVELEKHGVAARRFQREAHMASFLTHPGIAGIIDAGFQDQIFCIAMEFIAGENLEALMLALREQGRMLPIELSVTVILQVLDALAYAHEACDPAGAPMNIVHRDLSPRNLMLGFDGRARIIDFGIARGRVDQFRTAPGMLVGTFRYFSPEQARAEEIDHRSDLYAIAVVLAEMLSGRDLAPRRGSAFEVLRYVIEGEIPRLSSLNPRAPGALDEIIARGLAKDRAARFQTAAEFATALRGAAEDLVIANPAVLGTFVTRQCPRRVDEIERWRTIARRLHVTDLAEDRQTLPGDSFRPGSAPTLPEPIPLTGEAATTLDDTKPTPPSFDRSEAKTLVGQGDPLELDSTAPQPAPPSRYPPAEPTEPGAPPARRPLGAKPGAVLTAPADTDEPDMARTPVAHDPTDLPARRSYAVLPVAAEPRGPSRGLRALLVLLVAGLLVLLWATLAAST